MAVGVGVRVERAAELHRPHAEVSREAIRRLQRIWEVFALPTQATDSG